MAKQSIDTTRKFQALRDEILAGDLKPFYLLFGKEHYYIDELCRLIQEQALPPEERDFGQVVYYGADVTPAQVVSVARQFPMMVSRQVVVVKEAQQMDGIEELGVYLDAMMPTTVLVVCFKTNNDIARSKGRNIDKRTSFYKKACSVGVVFESEQIPDYRMPRWIEEYFASRGLKISPDAAALLAEFAGVDIAKIVMETDKLVKVLPPDTPLVTSADIAANVGMSRDYSAFELTKALSLKDAPRCYRIVHFFAESEKRFPLVVIMAALSSHFLKLLRYHALLAEGLPRNEILSQLGINPYFGGEYDQAIRNYPLKKTMRVISQLREYDQRSKSSARGSASDGELLTELVSKILA